MLNDTTSIAPHYETMLRQMLGLQRDQVMEQILQRAAQPLYALVESAHDMQIREQLRKSLEEAKRLAEQREHIRLITTPWYDEGHFVTAFPEEDLPIYQETINSNGDDTLYTCTFHDQYRLCSSKGRRADLLRFWDTFGHVSQAFKVEAEAKARKEREDKLWSEMKLCGSNIALEIQYQQKVSNKVMSDKPCKHTTVIIKLAFNGYVNIGVKGVAILSPTEDDKPEFGVKLAAERAIRKLASQLDWTEEQMLLFTSSIEEYLEW